MATLDEARAAKQVLHELVTDVDGVCGVGLACRGGEAGWVLQVNVRSLSARRRVPAVVAGVPVRVHVVGPVHALTA